MVLGNKNKLISSLEDLKSKFVGLNLIFELFSKDEIRLVGGCVRDMLLDRPISDVDLAIIYPPQQVIDRLKFHDKIKIIPTGIEHGTLTLVIEGYNFEVTSLRQDVECKGRSATVNFTNDWMMDASRRDFTINALYLDAKGNVYDFFDGMKDIRLKRIKFIGEAERRILEDYLRILRYFRFMAQLNFLNYEENELEVCAENMNLIKNLSKERLTNEVLKLLSVQDIFQPLKMLCESGFFNLFNLQNVKLNFVQDIKFNFNPLTKLLVLFKDPELIFDIFALSNKQKDYINFLHKTIFDNKAELNLLINENGKDKILNYLYYRRVIGIDDPNSKHIKITEEFEDNIIRKYPISGQDLISLGVKPGPELRNLLKIGKIYWADNDFTPNKEELLAFLSDRVNE